MAGLVAERLSKHFGGLRALSEVSLAVERGEILGLIGPNGSGKTTFLNLLTGIYRPTAGRVLLDGSDLTGRPPHRIARRGLGRTFQSIRLFGDLTVEENVRVPMVAAARQRGSPARSVAALLEEVGLLGRAGQRARHLPYGDQRRLEIARALAGEPSFLLLDEPAAGLNEAETDGLLELIAGIRERRGCGILVIDHDMRLILGLCDRVHVLDAGRSLFEGTPEEVRSSPEVAAAYLGERRARGG